MATMIIKQDHPGDPDPISGSWGRTGCWGKIRAYDFTNVIGIGAQSPEAMKHCLYNKVTWIGLRRIQIQIQIQIGVEVTITERFGSGTKCGAADGHPIWRFERFKLSGRILIPPTIRSIMYGDPSYRRAPYMHTPGSYPELDQEVAELLQLGEQAQPPRVVRPW